MVILEDRYFQYYVIRPMKGGGKKRKRERENSAREFLRLRWGGGDGLRRAYINQPPHRWFAGSGHRIDSHKHATVSSVLTLWSIAYYFRYWHSWRDSSGGRFPKWTPSIPPPLCFDSNPELLNPLLFGNMDREKILRFFSIETISCEFTRILQLSPLLEGNFLVISISLRNFYKELIVCRGCDYYTRAERRREGRRDEIARSNDEQEEGKMSNNWNKNNEWIGSAR